MLLNRPLNTQRLQEQTLHKGAVTLQLKKYDVYDGFSVYMTHSNGEMIVSPDGMEITIIHKDRLQEKYSYEDIKRLGRKKYIDMYNYAAKVTSRIHTARWTIVDGSKGVMDFLGWHENR